MAPRAGAADVIRGPGAAVAAAAWLACAGGPKRTQEPLVDIRDVDARILIDIQYATDRNFTKTTLYPANRCLLRASVAKRLSLAQEDLAKKSLTIKVWDCYRPLHIQQKLWDLVKDTRYVADPKKGSRHNRGAAVDVTLVDASGKELEMPTAYDDFSEHAHRGWPGASQAAAKNSKTLEGAMQKHGFLGLPTEWWHFDAKGWEIYPLEDVPL